MKSAGYELRPIMIFNKIVHTCPLRSPSPLRKRGSSATALDALPVFTGMTAGMTIAKLRQAYPKVGRSNC
jgi:hypothetical protein